MQAYIDDLLIIIKGDYGDNFEKLELTPQKLQDNGFKCNIKNLFFGKIDMEYPCFWLNQNGIWQINNKVEAIINMKPQNSQKQVCVFIGFVNYYRHIWDTRSLLLPPLTALTSNKVNSKWTDVEKKVFDEIKDIVDCDTLLVYMDFNKHFNIHTDDSDYHIGSVICQEGKPIAFYRCKLTGPQTLYT